MPFDRRKRFSEPKRSREVRPKKGQRSSNARNFLIKSRGRGDRVRLPMVKAVCDSCGKECELPFKPTAGKPVYCSDCFKSKGGDSRSSDNRGSKNSDLSRIEEKLDRILKILEKSD